MGWIRDIFQTINPYGGKSMLKQTSSSIRKQLTAFDGETITYSPRDRHAKFMQKVEAGPLLDMRHFNGDIQKAMGQWLTNQKK